MAQKGSSACEVPDSCTTSFSWPGSSSLRRKTLYPRKAGLLAYGSIPPAAFPVSQWLIGRRFPEYSDEFVQDSHLFPFSPEHAAFARLRHLPRYAVQSPGSIITQRAGNDNFPVFPARCPFERRFHRCADAAARCCPAGYSPMCRYGFLSSARFSTFFWVIAPSAISFLCSSLPAYFMRLRACSCAEKV